MKSKPDLSSLTIEEPHHNEDLNTYVQAVESFDEENATLTEDLEKYLNHVAKTGHILGTWKKVQKVFLLKMKQTMNEFFEKNPYKAGKINPNCENDDYHEMKDRLITLIDDFDSPPFTFQRLCELITNPRKNYSKCEKFMRAVEKNLMVVTPWSYSNTKRTSDTPCKVNGTFDSQTHYTSESTWSSLPPSPALTTTAPKIPDVTVTYCDETKKNNEGQSSDNTINNEATTPTTQPIEDDAKDGVNPNEQPDIRTENEVAVDYNETAEVSCSSSIDERNEIKVLPERGDSVSEIDKNPLPGKYCKLNIFMFIVVTYFVLPGVDTLVEKHSIIKTEEVQTSIVTDAACGDVSDKPIETPTDKLPVVQSPKRKLVPDNEVQMEIGSPTKRPKHDEAADETAQMETSNETTI
ncbi:uncharacterized protein LOC100179417 [Ciona intestinalis]